jgi:hypothetical protein
VEKQFFDSVQKVGPDDKSDGKEGEEESEENEQRELFVQYLRPAVPRSVMRYELDGNDSYERSQRSRARTKPQLPPKPAAHPNEVTFYIVFLQSNRQSRRRPQRPDAAYRRQSGAGNCQRQARSKFIVWPEFFYSAVIDVGAHSLFFVISPLRV